MYLDLLKRALTNLIYEDPPLPLLVQEPKGYNDDARRSGHDWPSVAHTMIGVTGLDTIESCLDQVIADGVPGDFVEAGVWRGGACIFARGYLKAHGIDDRMVWVADSFEGFPVIGEDGHPNDREYGFHRLNDAVGVSEATVRANFAKYDLLDEGVRFLPGWFRDSLPAAPIDRIAVLRLDGDLYESTRDTLVHLYPKVSVGGYVIVDDYLIPQCREAVHEYRAEHGLEAEPIEQIPGGNGGIYWRRS